MKKNFTYLFTAGLLLFASAAFAQPANDNVADAILLNVDSTTGVYTNVDATAEANEIIPTNEYWFDGETEAATSIWFKFIAPTDGKVTINSCDSATYLDSQFGVWSVGDASDFDTYTFVAGNEDSPNDCNDDNANGWSSFLELCGLEAGATYYLQVDGYLILSDYDFAEGSIALNLSNFGICAGPTELGADGVCDAIILPVDGAVYVYSNDSATAEVGEVVPPATDGLGLSDWYNGFAAVENSIWFKFLAPASGIVLISTCNAGDGGDNVDTQLAIWSSGDCNFGNFIPVVANDDFPSCTEGSIFKSNLYACGLEAGESYYLQVDGFGGASGDIAISATAISACPTATVQVVHNCADLAAEVIDVYANGALLINDFAFRTATPFVEVPAETNVTITVNLPTSTDSSGSLYSGNFVFANGSSNLITAQGLVSPSGYNTSVNLGTDLFLFNWALVFPSILESYPSPDSVAVMVIHGSTDAPAVDVVLGDLGTLEDLPYYSAYYYTVAAAEDLVIDITSEDGLTTIASYDAPLSTLGGQAITVFASGFLDPALNSNGPAFGICVATALGGPLLCLPEVIGLEENESISSISAYPNPTKDNLTLSFNLKNNNKVSMEIYDIVGNVVLSENFGQLSSGQNRKEIQLNNLASGLYSMNLLVNGTVLTQKIQVIK